jgi:site-specific DNA-adenine methylase
LFVYDTVESDKTITMTSLSSVVRLGPIDNNLSTQLLRTAIISFLTENADECDDSNDNNNLKANNNSHIVIRNKYFSADVILEDITDGNEQKQQQQQEDEEFNNNNNKEDGIILVFDALQCNPDRCDTGNSSSNIGGGGGCVTFDSLGSIHQQAIDNNTCGDLLRLCVGVSLVDLSPCDQKEYSRRVLWCLDNGYEYIEANISKEGQLIGHNDRDKDGFARIIEAIQGTVWSSAIMSASKTKKLTDSYADSKSMIQPNNKKEDTEENLYEPPDPSMLLTTQTTIQQQQDDASKSKNVDDVTGSDIPIKDDCCIDGFGLNVFHDEGKGDQSREDMEAEKLLEKMENVLKEATQIRKASKSGVLSDDERRERAGEAALALVNLMGEFGLDDDDDDDDDDDEDDNSEGYSSDDSKAEVVVDSA